MKWIVLAIVLGLGVYTWLTLHYRKQNPSFEPYRDIQGRANTVRLLSAGYQRITVSAQRPADPPAFFGDAAVTPAKGGLPGTLGDTLVVLPQIPPAYSRVSAAASVNMLFSYPVHFICTTGDNHQQLAGAQIYLRDGEVVIVPELEQLPGELLARTREYSVVVTIPAGALNPGAYRISLIGARSSHTWPLQVH